MSPSKTKPAKLLAEYKRKRDFTRTGEPDERGSSKSGRRFVVQKHAASRLHYDFRLELDGVLKSWAVTRGPSLSPAQKRLAVRTEDHPIAYADFEGTIPKGEYGGGTVMLWDEGEWEPLHDPHDGFKEGMLHFRLEGKRMTGGWALIRMKGKADEKRENWLLVKERDGAADDRDRLLEKNDKSVRTGRKMEEIAAAKGARKSDSSGNNSGSPRPKRDGKAAGKKGARKMERTSDQPAAGSANDEVAGVHLSNPGKVLFPQQGLTKSDLAAYYEGVAEWMLPHIKDRPLSLVRCPQGRGTKCFFQKHDKGGFPDPLKSVMIEEASGTEASYFYVDSLAGLVAGVQVGVLEFHIWGCKRDRIEQPDRLVFDLDPDEALTFADVRGAAIDIRDKLAALGLQSWPMVTGGKGIHIVLPLARRAGWDEMKGFARAFARGLADDEPERFVAKASKASRKGRIFVDWLRNDRGSTAITPYSTRAREGAPVAMPLSWKDLDGLKSANSFTVANALEHIAGRPDPWADMSANTQSITKKLLAKFA
jgi:bifunctional non-homologous end joining protein LigD